MNMTSEFYRALVVTSMLEVNALDIFLSYLMLILGCSLSLLNVFEPVSQSSGTQSP
jgi:hypothetical protein